MKEQDPKNRKVTVAIVNIANHRPRTTSGKLFCNFETTRNTNLKAGGNLHEVGRSKMPFKGILVFERKPSSAKRSIRFSYQSPERAKFRDKFPSPDVIQTGSEHGRSPNTPPYDQGCTEWNDEQEEFARHGAHKLHT